MKPTTNYTDMDRPQRPRVLHVVRQYRPSVGGMENYIEELTRRQSEDYEVTILTLDRVFGQERMLPQREIQDGVEIVRVPFFGSKKLFLPLVPMNLVRDADIVHVHCTDQLLDMVSLISRFTKAPLFVTTHGLFFHTRSLHRLKRIYLNTMTRFSLKRAKRIFACSGNDRKTLSDVGIDSTLLPNPIVPIAEDLTCYGDDLLYIGRLSENKRVDKLLTFMAALRDAGATIRLHVAGADQDGLGADLRAEAAALGIADLVKFHGFVTARELEELSRRSGFIVSASSYEGYGLSMVEGMSVGLMPVMQPNAAFKELYARSKSGLLLDFDDPDEAAWRFLGWRDHVRPEHREAARRFALAQSWTGVAEEIDWQYRLALYGREAARRTPQKAVDSASMFAAE